MDPLLISGGLGLLGSIFGGGPSMSNEQRQLFRLQRDAARSLQDYGKSVPGSAPQELAAMASMRGLMGQQYRGQMGGLFANLGASGSPAPADLLANIHTQHQGQQSSALSGLFANFLQSRQNAMLQSAQAAASALPSTQQSGGIDWGGLLGGIGQAWGYRQGMGAQLQAPTPGTRNFIDRTNDPRYQGYGMQGQGMFGLPTRF